MYKNVKIIMYILTTFLPPYTHRYCKVYSHLLYLYNFINNIQDLTFSNVILSLNYQKRKNKQLSNEIKKLI